MQETPLDEAQPAWWLELEQAEALQSEEAARRGSSEHIARGSRHFEDDLVKGKVRIGRSFNTTDPQCYENDTEFVVSGKDQKMDSGGISLLGTPPPWTLGDLNDIEDIRRRLIPPITAPASSPADSLSSTILVEYHCGYPSSDTESSFHVFDSVSGDAER